MSLFFNVMQSWHLRLLKRQSNISGKFEKYLDPSSLEPSHSPPLVTTLTSAELRLVSAITNEEVRMSLFPFTPMEIHSSGCMRFDWSMPHFSCISLCCCCCFLFSSSFITLTSPPPCLSFPLHGSVGVTQRTLIAFSHATSQRWPPQIRS